MGARSKSRYRSEMQTVVITGASMGIGRACALAWAERGCSIVVSARGEEALQPLAREIADRGGRAIVAPGDVTDEAYRGRLIERAVAETGAIDVLVNNAGRGFYAPVMKIDLGEMRKLFELNVFAPLHLAQLAAPHLAKSRGTVVMMSSVAGVVAAPRYGAYSASKFALEALSMTMRAELSSSGVRIVVVRPGPVKTPFRANAVRAPGEVGYDAPDPKGQTAEAVAARTLRAVDNESAVVETSAFVRFASAGARIAPPALRAVLRRMADKPVT